MFERGGRRDGALRSAAIGRGWLSVESTSANRGRKASSTRHAACYTIEKKKERERQNLERENEINAMAVDGDDETSEGAPALAHNKKRHFRSLSNWW